MAAPIGYWLISLTIIFVALIMYFVFTPVFEDIYINVHNATTIAEAHETQNMLMVLWNLWCPVIVLAAILIGFFGSQRHDPLEMY